MTKSKKITWKLQTKKLSDLTEYSKNPRNLTKKGLEDLKKSIQKFGVAEPLVINTDGVICGGHGRKKVLEGLKIEEVDCYVPNRALSEKEFEELNIRLNANVAGAWDFDKLANEWNLEDLKDWGAPLPMDWEERNEKPNKNEKEKSLEEKVIVKCLKSQKEGFIDWLQEKLYECPFEVVMSKTK